MTILKRLSQVAVKLEAAEGTAETLVAADATMLVYNPTYNPDIARFNRDPARAYLSRLAAVIGKQMAGISWRTELKGSGDVTSAPAWRDAIIACGMQELVVEEIPLTGAITGGPFQPGETVSGGTSMQTAIVAELTATGATVLPVYSVSGTFQAETLTGGTSGATVSSTGDAVTAKGFAYIPDSTDPSSATVGLYQDGVKKMIHGARGNFKIACVGGEPMFIDFDFTGVWNAWTDTALLSPTYETTVPPAFLNVGLSVHAYSAIFGNLNLDMGNVLTPRDSSSEAKGCLSVFITDRDPKGDLDPEMVLVATHDFMGRLQGGSTGYLSAQIGSSAGNRISIAAPNVQYASIGDGDRAGLAVANLGLELKGSGVNTGDDELILCIR